MNRQTVKHELYLTYQAYLLMASEQRKKVKSKGVIISLAKRLVASKRNSG